MVACGDDNLQPFVQVGNGVEERVELLFGLCGRVGAVKHVAAHQQGVGPFFFYEVLQPFQEMPVLGCAVKTVEVVAEMPVGSMYYLHACMRECC